ncbi:hypothetical protein [Streptomyces sp. NPDC002588]|uniref:hypothetical protein n=1 Tax=Streptomyces sp. NPDC002588 TaxID=3154419 RepID=UPI00331E38EA
MTGLPAEFPRAAADGRGTLSVLEPSAAQDEPRLFSAVLIRLLVDSLESGRRVLRHAVVMGPVGAAELGRAVSVSPFRGRYAQAVDRESVFERPTAEREEPGAAVRRMRGPPVSRRAPPPPVGQRPRPSGEGEGEGEGVGVGVCVDADVCVGIGICRGFGVLRTASARRRARRTAYGSVGIAVLLVSC